MTLGIPSDRSGVFDPQFIENYQRRFSEFDNNNNLMYGRGMSLPGNWDILENLHIIDVSPNLFSAVKIAVFDEVTQRWN